MAENRLDKTMAAIKARVTRRTAFLKGIDDLEVRRSEAFRLFKEADEKAEKIRERLHDAEETARQYDEVFQASADDHEKEGGYEGYYKNHPEVEARLDKTYAELRASR